MGHLIRENKIKILKHTNYNKLCESYEKGAGGRGLGSGDVRSNFHKFGIKSVCFLGGGGDNCEVALIKAESDQFIV